MRLTQTNRMGQLGAIRFDRDLRAIIGHLSVGDARDKFTRLQQVSTLLNLDEVSRSLSGYPITRWLTLIV